MFRCFKSPWGMLILIGAAVLATYLVIWHGQHIAALLPLALVLLCPLSHMLMHRHGTSHREGSQRDGDASKVHH